MFTDISKCECGAITVHIDNVSYSMPEADFEEKFTPYDDIPANQKLQDTYCCDHCVNHWGTDICACGSGEKYDECEGGFDECGSPMQSIEDGRQSVKADDAWI